MNALVMLAVLGTGQAAGTDSAPWLDDYGVALAKCKELGKPLLIVIDRPQVEGARLEQISFRKDEKPEPLLKNYILCRIDATTEYGEKVAKAFGAGESPFTAIVSKTGTQVLYTKRGKFTAVTWKSALNTYRSGVQPVTYRRATTYRSSYSGYSGFGGFFGGGGC